MAPRKPRQRDMTFGRILQRLMTEQGVGVRELASRVGSSPANISDYRNGVMPTDFHLVRRMAVELGVTMSFLLTGEDDPRPDGRTPLVTEVFDDDGAIYDGFAHIVIRRLIPRNRKRSDGGGHG